jgi:hypothetical protein
VERDAFAIGDSEHQNRLTVQLQKIGHTKSLLCKNEPAV